MLASSKCSVFHNSTVEKVNKMGIIRESQTNIICYFQVKEDTMPAILEIFDALIECGYTEAQADLLISKLLLEEAKGFVEFVEQYKNADEPRFMYYN